MFIVSEKRWHNVGILTTYVFQDDIFLILPFKPFQSDSVTYIKIYYIHVYIYYLQYNVLNRVLLYYIRTINVHHLHAYRQKPFIDWGLTPFSKRKSVISRRPVQLFMCFLAFYHQYSTQHTFQATGCFSIYTVSPLVQDE